MTFFPVLNNTGILKRINIMKIKKCFLELRSYNLGLNEICLKIENVINDYSNDKKAA